MRKPSKVSPQNLKHLRRKNSRCLWIILFMIACLMFFYTASNWLGITINRNLLDFVSGMFSSLTLVLAVCIVRNYRVLRQQSTTNRQGE